ncbi:MAG: GGDEF domain-containing protein [Sandaracinaceae bacterium]|nr:GGDEF domain-containing protein [Myxococcales bacterium]MCB9661920.1 GGDEF domain-containing protein [Sandaracinaceae bacterium]
MVTGNEKVGPHALACLLGLVGVGYLDHVTGNEIRLFPLYYVPIGWAAWYGPTWLTVASVVGATVAWLVAALTSGLVYSQAFIWPLNTAVQLLAFGVLGALLVGLKRRLAREVRAGRYDALTTVLNKRGFEEAAAKTFGALEPDEDRAVFVFVDLDNFKQVNDTQGHDAGDAALVEAARLLRSSTRQRDAVARWGGDEFVLLLADTDLAHAETVLERLRSALQAEMTRRGWPITASIGALEVSTAGATLTDVLKAADTLMYEAKREKNKVVAGRYKPGQATALAP